MARNFRPLLVLWLASAFIATAVSLPTEAPGTTITPTTPAATTAAPTTAATTAAPTTAATTAAPTTAATTAAPTTAATTAAPTTAATTAAPTTAATTAAPTTAATTADGGTTKAPTPAATTADGGTTKAPTPAATTADGGDGTTKAPTPAATTADGGDGTTKAPTPAATTADGGDGTTKAPTPAATTAGGGDKTTKPSTPAATTVPNPCKSDSCGDGSSCSPRFNQTFQCLCPGLDVYDYERRVCEIAKVYPGQLTLSILYDVALGNPASEEFEEKSSLIIAELNEAFRLTVGYLGSTVLRFRQAGSSRVFSRAGKGVLADVENTFETNTDYDDAAITKTLTDHIEKLPADSPLAGGTFTEGNLCDKAICDATTTECKSEKGSVVCDCKKEYVPTTHSTSVCVACPSGKKAVGSKCEPCPYGYSGFNCDESWQLILVIVGSVFGALLLISVIALVVIARRPARKSSKKNKDEKAGGFSTKAPLVSNSTANSRGVSMNGSANAFASAGVPRIPRATTTSSLDRRTNMEMTPSNSRQNLSPAGRNPRLYDDPDDMNPYARSRPQSSNYAQSKPQSNLYAQSRPQTNPYASNQGYANPYYKHDNGRPLY